MDGMRVPTSRSHLCSLVLRVLPHCLLAACVIAAAGVLPHALSAQGRSTPTPTSTPTRDARASIDSFVVVIRDMAAWALVTPAAHIPVGGILDNAGEVATVVGSRSETIFTPESTLVSFRRALAVAARESSCQAIGLAYMVHTVPPHGRKTVDAVVVEVEHRNGYRANLVFPYSRDDAQDPVFGEAFVLPGSLRGLPVRRTRRNGT